MFESRSEETLARKFRIFKNGARVRLAPFRSENLTGSGPSQSSLLRDSCYMQFCCKESLL